MAQTTKTQQPHDTRQPAELILVLAATGKTGRRVVDRLHAAGLNVRAASRSSEVQFDWNDRATWSSALNGVSTVYVALPLTPAPVEDFVAQATAAGVRRFVALSGRGADVWETHGREMVELEDAVRHSGVEWSILRASNFAQNFDEDVFREAIMAGELILPVGGVTEPFVDVEDVADVAVALLTGENRGGRIVEVTGPESLAWGEAVAIIARESGLELRFADVSPEQYATHLLAQGLPDADAKALDTMFAEIRRGRLTEPTNGVREILGRDARTFRDYAARAAAAGAWS
ncbi:MAG TPA: NAD(P)H-binding protein [Candidatus Agrococcus pullicola]|uniref:NAD(P)H-binding protein n=1 Tax=Candidatus Agrococcus pullicola TaxID=2838429 RepID=A0A9D1YU84_9MICO|nr:NAD(P)H-binding protein [Candidatus Agrococcus pullicola]